jgi:hypothetical protein
MKNKHYRIPFAFLVFALGASLSAQSPNADLTTRKILFSTVPRTTSAPVLDGDLNEACWQNARKIDDFTLTAGDREKPVQFKTTARLLFDDTHLYVAFECMEPDPRGLKATATLHDDPDMEYDDRVEVFLDVDHDHRHYWELAVNPKGVQFDQAAFYRLHGSRTCDFFPEKNLFWRAKTKVGTDRWVVEIAIDVTSLGLARLDEGTTWGLNLARVRQPDVKKGDELLGHKLGAGAEYSAWARVQDYIGETISNFHAPMEFADVVMGDPGFAVETLQLPSARFTLGPVGRATEFGWNPLEVKLRTSDGAPKKLSVELSVEPPSVHGWKDQRTTTFRSGENEELRYYVPEEAENKLVLRVLDPATGRQLYRTSYVETAPPFVEFDFESLYVRAPKAIHPVGVKLLTDATTRAAAELHLSFQAAEQGKEIATAVLSDLTGADRLTPVFDINQLRALPGGNYVVVCRLTEKATGKLLGEFRQKLTKFAPELPKAFSAARVTHSFGGVTGDAIRVQFPFAAEFVFWRGANYIPWWEMDQMAMSNEFIECWGGGGQGCNEPMQDRECRYSRVELLESSPARAVVHWRYALNDAHYRIYFNEWVDEYYVLYPDGVGVRQVKLWANSATQHEVLDTLMVKPPGTHTAQLFGESVATLANLEGRRISVQTFSKDRELYRSFLRSGKDFIMEFDFKDRMHPFTVFSFRDDLMPGVSPGMVSVCRTLFQNADQRGHWPSSRYAIDGYNAVGLDVPTHFAFGNIHSTIDPQQQPNAWLFLIGAAPADSDTPAAQAKAWLYPAEVKILDGTSQFRGYDSSQRAYRVTAARGATKVELQLNDSRGDVFHPVFLLESATMTDVRVRVNGEPLAAETCHVAKTAAGETVVFVNATFKPGATFTFESR